ncbi:hypothetical protein DPMN_058433 [Dreissena polymorpha]|uniref:Uncharacterized protein n=1 Tax=Dreissena polymorpha TaxID=45954 RepID=A0A9D4C1Q9_DREPO|nr:hypothetical protein DPMN_058433 [Dreissena polymorpha]
MKEAKVEFIDEQCINKEMTTGSSKKACSTLKTLRKLKGVLNSFTIYSSDLCNYPLQPDPSLLQNDHTLEDLS